MTTTQAAEEKGGRDLSKSALVAAEIRAELGRRGTSEAQFALKSGLGQMWCNRRFGRKPSVPITIEDAVLIADALGLPLTRLFTALLPRLDSNQQPSD